MTIFERGFGDYLSMAKSRCEWEALKFKPSSHKLHEILDTFQKIVKDAFGAEARRFIEKAIYAKNLNHVVNIQ